MPPQPPAPSRLSIEVGDPQSRLSGPDRRRLAAIAGRVLAGERVDRAEVSIAVVDDPTIHQVNRRHLGHDAPTDVISFPLSEPGDGRLSGELIVSAETAARMAGADGHDPFTELALYVIHGLLHLCGRDDLTESGAASMRRREGELLAAEGLSHPFSPDPGRPGTGTAAWSEARDDATAARPVGLGRERPPCRA